MRESHKPLIYLMSREGIEPVRLHLQPIDIV
jgi:hypothetical protein